jgi:hypothetical protein
VSPFSFSSSLSISISSCSKTSQCCADYITRREPSPPSLVIALFQLTKDLAPSDLLFVESLPPTVNLLPVFTKTDICPLDQIVERKRLLNTRIQSLRDIVAREAEDEVEVEAQGQGLKPELPRRGRTWPGMCVAIKPGWVLRDQVSSRYLIRALLCSVRSVDVFFPSFCVWLRPLTTSEPSFSSSSRSQPLLMQGSDRTP